MTSQPLNALIVTEDRRVLRRLSRFLGTFGYSVQQAAEKGLALACFETASAELLIVDAEPSMDDALELCRLASPPDGPRCVYTLLMVRQPTAEVLKNALEAGVDDFLAKPVVYGEFLVRLRAGARAVELERRLRDQKRPQPLSGLAGPAVFHDRLRHELAAAASRPRPVSCVVLDIDLLHTVNHCHGHPAGDLVIRAVADGIKALCGESAFPAALGGGRFGVLLPDTTEEQAVAWAERARADVAQAEVNLGEHVARLSISGGVAEAKASSATAEALIEQASSALDTAKQSGRNCVVRSGQFDDDTRAWTDLAAPGKLFEHTVARDVMTPCPLVLRYDDRLGRAAALLKQTGLNELPVADASGKLVGLVTAEQVPAPSGGDDGPLSVPVSEVMDRDVPSYDEDASFATLMTFFARGSGGMVVIVNDGCPTGLVTPAGLTSLGQPLTRDTFTAGVPSSASDYLLISDPGARTS